MTVNCRVEILPLFLPRHIFLQKVMSFNNAFLTALALPGHHRSESGSSDLTKIRGLLQCNGFSRPTPGSCRRDSQ